MAADQRDNADPPISMADPTPSPRRWIPLRHGWQRRRLKRWALRIVKVLAVVLVLAVVFVAIFGWWSIRRPFPDTDGDFTIAGLDGPVDIIRDKNGVPHIYASTAHDLFLAQGLVHAQDRFWQMDVWRHIGAGRLSEMFGEDQVDTDTFLRTLGWAAIVEDELAIASPESLTALNGYSAGVNAYLADRSPSELAFEYTILELVNHAYDPEPWTPLHTLTWGKVMAWDLRGNMDEEINRALLLGTMTPEELQLIYPDYRSDHPVITTDGIAQRGTGISPPPVTPGLALRRVQAGAASLDALTGGGGDGIGSNSWVISGEHTASGMPILANDPHLGIQIPSIWYQIGLHCEPVTTECPYDVVGFSFAGVPGVVIGANQSIAWGLTNLGPDVMDLYVERLDPNDRTRYEVNGQFVPMDVTTDIIDVAGGESVEIEIHHTRHGPVVSGTYGRLDDFAAESGLEPPEPYAIALRWTALDVNPPITEPILRLNAAKDFQEFRSALSLFAAPAQNVVYADRSGNIGYQAPGRIPIRAAGDGRIPVPGWTDEFEWTGFIAFDDLPTVFNPPEGYVVAANNPVVDGRYPHLLTTDWNHGHRAARIVEMIESVDRFDIETVAAMQVDTFNPNAADLVPSLLAVDVGPQPEIVRTAHEVLSGWGLYNEKDSAGAAVFEATWREILSGLFDDDLPEGIDPLGGARWFEVVRGLIAQPSHRFWDDATTTVVETRDDVLLGAFADAVAMLASRFGDDPNEWRWGDLHRATFENQTLGQSGIGPIEMLLNRGPVRVGGGTDIVNAVGWTPGNGFLVDWIPSMRMIVDLADLDSSLSINSTGQSGHPYHARYDDFMQMWADGEYSPMRFSKETVTRSSTELLQLSPAR